MFDQKLEFYFYFENYLILITRHNIKIIFVRTKRY